MRTEEAEQVGSARTLKEQQQHFLGQSGAAPDLKCPKTQFNELTVHLVQALRDAGSVRPERSVSLPRSAGAANKTWRDYQSPLRIMGLAERQGPELVLTEAGKALADDPSTFDLPHLVISRVRLLGECLDLTCRGTTTVKAVHEEIVDKYHADWGSLGNVRLRLAWLEAFGLVEYVDASHIAATARGHAVLAEVEIVSPEAISYRSDAATASLPAAPQEISSLIERLRRNPAAMDARTTYNIWVPSPPGDPSKIANLAEIVEQLRSPIDKEKFLGFIAERFGLKRSSVDSMLPFMRAGGLVQEVRKGIYTATPAALEWIDSGESVNFIRLLHCHLRYVGEIVRTVGDGASRQDVYRSGVGYGMNKEKCRWLISFLIDAGLLIETSWTGLEASPLGKALMASLPLADIPAHPLELAPPNSAAAMPAALREQIEGQSTEHPVGELVETLVAAALDPLAGGRPSGTSLEICIERAFELMGFDARRIGGSGDSDVVVRWRDSKGELRVASVDAKSSSSGAISHTHVSDVALTSHAEKNGADFIAIVAPGFSGTTLRDMAALKGWVLVTANELASILKSSVALGLRPRDIGLMFESPDGPSQLSELIEARHRELDVISLIIARLRGESANDEAVSARDISLIERRSELAPTIEELIAGIATLRALDDGAILVESASSQARHETYVIGDVWSAANRLRAFARALERGLSGPVL